MRPYRTTGARKLWAWGLGEEFRLPANAFAGWDRVGDEGNAFYSWWIPRVHWAGRFAWGIHWAYGRMRGHVWRWLRDHNHLDVGEGDIPQWAQICWNAEPGRLKRRIAELEGALEWAYEKARRDFNQQMATTYERQFGRPL